MHSQVRNLLAQGIVRRSSSEYASPVVMVRKSNKTFRLCVDYRKINALTKISAYPLPYMDSILYELRNSLYHH